VKGEIGGTFGRMLITRTSRVHAGISKNRSAGTRKMDERRPSASTFAGQKGRRWRRLSFRRVHVRVHGRVGDPTFGAAVMDAVTCSLRPLQKADVQFRRDGGGRGDVYLASRLHERKVRTGSGARGPCVTPILPSTCFDFSRLLKLLRMGEQARQKNKLSDRTKARGPAFRRVVARGPAESLPHPIGGRPHVSIGGKLCVKRMVGKTRWSDFPTGLKRGTTWDVRLGRGHGPDFHREKSFPTTRRASASALDGAHSRGAHKNDVTALGTSFRICGDHDRPGGRKFLGRIRAGPGHGVTVLKLRPKGRTGHGGTNWFFVGVFSILPKFVDINRGEDR